MDQDITPPAQSRLIPRGPKHPMASMVLQEQLVACLYPQLRLHGMRQFNPSGMIECRFHRLILRSIRRGCYGRVHFTVRRRRKPASPMGTSQKPGYFEKAGRLFDRAYAALLALAGFGLAAGLAGFRPTIFSSNRET